MWTLHWYREGEGDGGETIYLPAQVIEGVLLNNAPVWGVLENQNVIDGVLVTDQVEGEIVNEALIGEVTEDAIIGVISCP